MLARLTLPARSVPADAGRHFIARRRSWRRPMKLAAFGDTARNIGAIAARLAGVSDVIPVTLTDSMDGEAWTGLLVDGEGDGAARIAETALANGRRVLLTGIPKNEPETWMKPARDGLTLSRPLRFDPHIARAKEVVRG